jgi:tRNA(fMet)-specific endonuclease VapC
VRGYRELEGILSDFARAQVLPFSAAAADIYDDLRRSRIRVGPMDLRIASIAVANQMTVLTTNALDFQRVPNLSFEDWTRS